MTLQIPFYRPHVDPWVISISSLHLIGAPEKLEDFDDEKEKLLERERKKALLQALEDRWKASHTPLGHPSSCGEAQHVSRALDVANPRSFLCRMNASGRGSPTGIQSLPQ